MKKVIHIKTKNILTNDELFDLKDTIQNFTISHPKLGKRFCKELEKMKKQIEKDKWDILHTKQKIRDIIFDLIKNKCWYKVEMGVSKFFFFPYKFNYNTNNIIVGLYVPIDDNYCCGIMDKMLYFKDFVYNDSKWTKVSEKKVLKYAKDNLKNVIQYRMNRTYYEKIH